MRIDLIFLCSTALFVQSCSKAAEGLQEPESGCIERHDIAVTEHAIYNSDLQTAQQLFTSNAFNPAQFRFHYYLDQMYRNSIAPFDSTLIQVVRVDQYANGKRIINGSMNYTFHNGLFETVAGVPTAGTSLDAIPALTEEQVLALFLQSAELFEQKGTQYSDSCYKVEFGYYNLNGGTSNTTENLVKAWRISPNMAVRTSLFPIACYQDGGGKLIYYDNGIRVFK